MTPVHAAIDMLLAGRHLADYCLPPTATTGGGFPDTAWGLPVEQVTRQRLRDHPMGARYERTWRFPGRLDHLPTDACHTGLVDVDNSPSILAQAGW